MVKLQCNFFNLLKIGMVSFIEVGVSFIVTKNGSQIVGK